MFSIYSGLISLYHWFLHLAALVNPKAKLWVNGRKQQVNKFESIAKKWAGQYVIMVHAASYGEYEMAKPIVAELLKDAEVRILVSFYSPSGFENTHFEDDRIKKIYLPIDLYKRQNSFIEIINPKKVLFIKYEFWFNLLRVLNSKKIPYYYSSLHLNKQSYLFKNYMNPFLDLIKKSKKIYCHNPESEAILKAKGFNNTSILGDTRIQQAKLNLSKNEGLLQWNNEKPVLAFGSIIESEFGMLSETLNAFPNCNFIIAPHEIDDETIAKLKSLTRLDPLLYSMTSRTPEASLTASILIVNTLGDLRHLYRNADVAYVGAGFEKGPHNVIEPLIYGVPTICGPNINKFPMAQHLDKKKLLKVISTPAALQEAIQLALKVDRDVFNISAAKELNQLEANIDNLIKELSPN